MPHPARRRSVRLVAVLAALLAAAPVLAAGTDGRYAVRGAGGLPCPQFLALIGTNPSEMRMAFTWIDGALSVANRLTPGVFDSSPFLAPGAFGAVVVGICRERPQLNLDGAVAQALEHLRRIAPTRDSPPVEIVVGEASVAIRQETLIRLQERLRELRLFTGTPDGRFTVATREAIRRFQASAGLPQTAVPDVDTVIALLLR